MEKLDLNKIASTLEGLEETIIFKLIDRAQFKSNQSIYIPGNSHFQGANNSDSLIDIRLLYQEKMDSEFGRFCIPEERPFNKGLPIPKRNVKLPETSLHIYDYNLINLTQDIKKIYIDLIPLFCKKGDDSQHGSSVESDIYVLQAISRRVHYGAMYVAESKYQNNPKQYQKLIDEKDSDGLMKLLTREEIEEKIIYRVYEKIKHAQKDVNINVRNIIEPKIILNFYKEYIIPLTKKGEIKYLLYRFH